MIIGIVGPTGTGKSELGIRLAHALKTDIISADAYQVYQGMDIATAKVLPADQEGITHHLIDCVSPEESFDVRQYQTRARAHIEAALKENKFALMVGGSGYYIKAALHDLQFLETSLSIPYPSQETMWQTIEKKAPALLEKLHINNEKRLKNAYARVVTGALELSHPDTPVYPYQLFGLTMPREALRRRTDARIDRMIEAGLEAEARRLSQRKLSQTAREAIGYKEWSPYFADLICKEDVVQTIKRHTHQYIKKQAAYFAHQLPIQWFDVSVQSIEAISQSILQQLKVKASD